MARFSQVLDLIRESTNGAYRTGWNGTGMFIYVVQGSMFDPADARGVVRHVVQPGRMVEVLPHIDMKTATGALVPWLASQTDILADDWKCFNLEDPADYVRSFVREL